MKELLYFTANWCTACKKPLDIIRQKAQDAGILLRVLDVDANTDMVQEYNVQGVPTIILVDENNNIRYRQTGSGIAGIDLEELL